MDARYFLAETRNSFGELSRLMLGVASDGSIFVERGETNDRFELGRSGKPVCTTEGENSLPYSMEGPLTEDEIRHWSSLNEGAYFNRFPRGPRMRRSF